MKGATSGSADSIAGSTTILSPGSCRHTQ
jgi:hypothetical protein